MNGLTGSPFAYVKGFECSQSWLKMVCISSMMLGFPEWIVYVFMVPPLVLTAVIGLVQAWQGFEPEAQA